MKQAIIFLFSLKILIHLLGRFIKKVIFLRDILNRAVRLENIFSIKFILMSQFQRF